MGWGGGRAVGKCTGGGVPCPEPFPGGLTGSATGATCVKVEHTREWTRSVGVNAGTSVGDRTLVSGYFLRSQVDPGRATPGLGLRTPSSWALSHTTSSWPRT